MIADVTTLQPYLTSQSLTNYKFLRIPFRQHPTHTFLSKSTNLDETVTTLSNLSNPERFTDALHLCISSKSLHHGQKIHTLILKNPKLRHDPKLLSKLITLFSVCRRLDLARKLFNDVKDSTFLTEKLWASMAIAYSRNGSPRESLIAYVDMLCSFVAPGDFSISVALKACVELKDVRFGRGVHAQIVKGGRKVDQVVENVLLRFYMEMGFFEDARKVFDGMSERNVVTWNSLVSVLSGKGRVKEMFSLFRKMQEERIGFSWATLTTILPACSRVAGLMTGKEIHGQVVKASEGADVLLVNSLMDMYGKCGEVVYARRIFDGMLSKDLTSWNVMLNSYAINGDVEEEISLFDMMIESGVEPDGITFVALLSGCSDTGRSKKLSR
ncbi:unnamed protein product [Eruca vesicaria subsp. sativa]|uniref:Pentatricopeptide repeat-containing protein n=1 Tax=Eruca vesicaria subsp. sativa TaxID=29727 RepID=A0ABC8K1F7_ERUVS|nr:unnamed protein product [Eruca vesicaria subsp. sativa]